MTAAIDFDVDMFCWWELGTTDAMAAREFYTELFAWNTVDTPMSPEGVYTSLQLGSKIILPPFDVMDMGRMSVIEDPTGATVALWQTLKDMGPMLTNQIGSVCWNELYTRDMAKSREFYTRLLDWTAQEMVMNDHPYVIFKKGEKQVASMMEITAEMDDAPPHWLLYFAVENCDETVAKAQSKGALILYNSRDIPNVGRFAIIQDLQEAVFAVFQMSAPAE